MEKGFLILIGTFVVVGILHFISMRIMNLSETKKIHFRKLYFYFYGIIFMLGGGLNLIEKSEFYSSFSIQFLVGLIFIILNFIGKLETKTKDI